MRRSHFEALQPVCPVCRPSFAANAAAPPRLRLAHLERETGEHILEGVLHCENPACLREYPIIDGVPLIVGQLRKIVGDQIHAINARDDLGPIVSSLIGDCCGAGSAFDQARQHLSMYGFGHYGDLPISGASAPREAADTVATLAAAAHALVQPLPAGPVLDAGCSLGRATFEMAGRTDALVLGVDLNFAMLRAASTALRDGRVRFPQRKVGLVYGQATRDISFLGAGRVDFWMCDALALPFADATFGAALALNLLDCVPDPRTLLVELARLLRDGGRAAVASPYDWSTSATAVEGWIGGHSQRSPLQGESAAILRALLTRSAHPSGIDELAMIGERDDLPWSVRLHDRSTVTYRVHLVAAERRSRS